jgi:hypothetical protein
MEQGLKGARKIMKKLNCWEFMKCGREPGGSNVAELGVCPASIETRASGIHEGVNAGRCCWAFAGTFCGGKVQGTFAQKFETCTDCPFYKTVTEEEDKYLTVDEINAVIENEKYGSGA